MTPVDLYDDHRRRPRFIGKLQNADIVGDIGSIVVGDAMRVYLGLADQRIREARFQVFNAPNQVASASALCELAQGKTLDEALRIGPRELCAHLGGLDPAELPPRVWAIDGLRAAILSKRGTEPPCDDDIEALLCRCHGIHEQTVRESITVMDLHDAEAVVAATGAGTACGTCRSDLPALIDAVHRAPAAPIAAPASTATAVLGRIPTLLTIQRAVQTHLLPQWQGQGGQLELWDFDGSRVHVKALGAFARDAAAARSAAEALETLLKQQVHPGLGVVLAG